jgi:8-oxo-dGTP pyrophosphatase MutT (NUDIX family)
VRAAISVERVRRAVAAAPKPAPPAPSLDVEIDAETRRQRPAAVLVALFEEDGETRVVLTRRSRQMRSHTGEVAFPGGRVEAGEAPVAAALREAAEEVGIQPAAVEVLGQLSPLTTIRGRSAISSFVGLLPGRPLLCPSPFEVEHAFDVALAELMADGVAHEERWDIPGPPDRPIHFFDLPHDLVWGATARILFDLLTLVIAQPRI